MQVACPLSLLWSVFSTCPVIATTNPLFLFDGQLFEQTDGVAMGSPLGPLMVNVFMCHLKEQLVLDVLMPRLHRRYADDALLRVND